MNGGNRPSSNGTNGNRGYAPANGVKRNSPPRARERGFVARIAGVLATVRNALSSTANQSPAAARPSHPGIASFVENPSGLVTPVPSVVAGHVATPTVVKVERLPGRYKVYDLQVEGTHEFFANGVLVHNTWKNAMYVWDMAMFGLRMGDEPQAVATTTPRPTELVKTLVKEARDADNPEGTVAITGGSTFENAKNLAKTFLSKIVRKYEGTRLGDQELYGKLLLDMPGALWSAALIEQFRINLVEKQNGEVDNPLQNMDLYRVVVGVDPMTKDPATEQDVDNPSETGIVVCGLGPFDDGYVLDDLSAPGTPNEWATRAIRAARLWHADHIIAEVNNGGLMVKNTIETIDSRIPVRMVTASRGKITRAEPISSLYEQGRIHHVGNFPKLEEQMTTYTGLPKAKGEKSPDRMDALVWAMTDLCVGAGLIEEVDPYMVQTFAWAALNEGR
jgi:phage terminase large subunit-like protein